MKNRKIKKRYIIIVLSICLAILSVLLLRFLDNNFNERKIIIEKELKAIMAFSKDAFSNNNNQLSIDEKSKLLRDKFANKISYKKLLNENSDFKNFKYLPNQKIYGIKLLNNAHLGFYYNSDKCGKITGNNNYCAGIIIDVNGYTRPNQFGQDQFLLKIFKDNISE